MEWKPATNEQIEVLRHEIRSGFAAAAADAEALREGLAGVNKRLDTVNGNIAKHAAQIADINVQMSDRSARLKGLEHEIFERPHRDASPAPFVMPPELKELMEMARDARGVARFGKVLWAIGGALVPIFMWWWSTGRVTP